MLIVHRTAQLGVVNQKRPEVWQSYLVLPIQHTDVGKVSMSIGSEQKLREILHSPDPVVSSASVSLSVGDHKLVDLTKEFSVQDDTVSVSLGVGDHKLIDPTKETSVQDDTVSVSLGVGDHKLYNWGVFAQVLDEDNLTVSLAIGDHKLYEE